MPDYNTPDWMTPHIEGDVQTAIQSQTIQTALEANTSKITDAGFQSFLVNAPIPRFAADDIAGAFNAGAAVTPTWGFTGNYHNPYEILKASTGAITIPIDGYYTIVMSFSGTSTAGGTIRIYFTINGAGAFFINTSPPVAGTNTFQCTSTLLFNLRQGDVVRPIVLNDTAGNFGGNYGQLTGVWNAPFNQYVGGN